MEPGTAQTQLTPTTTTGQLAITTASAPEWNIDTFGLGTSAGTEGEKEDSYNTDTYFKTYDGKWYSKDEINEAIWEKFKGVYNWKHMRGSTAHAIENDVLDIIKGLYDGDLTINGGLLYTVKGSKNYDNYSSWKSKYEGNKPHHANSKYDSDAKNNAAWVVMSAFGTLTDEDTKKKRLQKSASTDSLAALKKELSGSMLLSLGIPDPSDLSNWYDIDDLNESTLTRGNARRLEKILGWLNDIGNEYSQKDLKKEYGLTDKQISQFKSALSSAYKAIQDGTIDSGDLHTLDALRFFGVNLNWRDLLKTDFGSDELKADQANKRKQEEELIEQKAYEDFINALYSSDDSGTDPKTLPVHSDEDINEIYQDLLPEINVATAETIKSILKAAITLDSTNNVYNQVLQMANGNKELVLLVILQAAKKNNILKLTGNPDSSSEYYVPFLGSQNHIYVVDFSNDKITRKWVKITDIPALEKAIKDTYDTGVTGSNWWDAFKKAASLTL